MPEQPPLKDPYQDPLQMNPQDPEAQLDQAEAFFKKQMQEAFDWNQLVARLFNTKDGKKFLEVVRKQTIEAGAWSPAMVQEKGMEAATATAFAREGQCAMVRDWENRVALSALCQSPEDLIDMTKAALANNSK